MITLDTEKLVKALCDKMKDLEGLPWMNRYSGSFRPDEPPYGEARVEKIGVWLYVIVNIMYDGTTMDQTTDRLSGDPYEAVFVLGWIGLAETAPKKVSKTEELDEWAKLTTKYVMENTDVGIWGEHDGSWISRLEEDGTVTIKEVSGRFQDEEPESLGTEKIVKLEE